MEIKVDNTKRHDSIKYLESYPAALKHARGTNIILAATCAVLCLGCIYFSFQFAESQKDLLYVLDKGVAMTATKVDESDQKANEVYNFLNTFYNNFFTVEPVKEVVQDRINSCLAVGDKSVSSFYNANKENKFYEDMFALGATQSIAIDSIVVNLHAIPYEATVFFRRYVVRPESISYEKNVSTCQVREVGRSRDNPHGMRLEQFKITFRREMETRKRSNNYRVR